MGTCSCSDGIARVHCHGPHLRQTFRVPPRCISALRSPNIRPYALSRPAGARRRVPEAVVRCDITSYVTSRRPCRALCATARQPPSRPSLATCERTTRIHGPASSSSVHRPRLWGGCTARPVNDSHGHATDFAGPESTQAFGRPQRECPLALRYRLAQRASRLHTHGRACEQRTRAGH